MADLLGGPSASSGNGRGNNGRVPAAPGSTGSPVIKGPREIMRERANREAQRRAEQEAKEELERSRAEEEARQLEENNRRSAERRARAAAAAGAAVPPQRGSGEASQRASGATTGQRISDNSQRSERRSGGESGRPGATLQGVGRGGAAVGGGESRTRPTQQQQSRPAPPETSSRTRPSQAQPGPSNAPPQNQPPPEATASAGPTRSSFPHAFERWETLSAHWEGLTSFWIRRLEENSNEINRDPLSQQLSRQVTDLSAAGANLFHAVVELQRLRASSERKFQRWFFETRAEQERAQEIQAMTENSLESERRERAAAIAEAVSKERERNNVHKQLEEMKRELQISKEEAKRAWEELGRREQEERERTASLREGQPTIVGGVQVVPMMQGVPSRHGSTRDVPPTREGPYSGGPSGSAAEPEGPVDSDTAYQQYSRSQRADPADPFIERTPRTAAPTSSYASPSATYAPEYSQAPAVQPASTGAFYQQHQGTSLHPIERDPSEGALSEGEYEIDEYGNFVTDDRGNKIPYQPSDDGTDEYDVASERAREQANLQRYGTTAGYSQASTATAAAPSSQPTTEPGNVDYSGAGYGAGEWGAVPRHHHPTRLSDVLEEDERSRTSASQVSRRE